MKTSTVSPRRPLAIGQTSASWAFVLACVFTSLTLFTSLSASVQSQTPVFRSKIELMQLDVTVLDKNGAPVRGLTAADFTVLEDKKPQTIHAFSAIDVPDASTLPPPPKWTNTSAKDVVSNEFENDRIFVLVLDDAAGMSGNDPWGKREMKKTAESLIDKLGPSDQAAVVFTGAGYRSSQGLTSDHGKLLQAVRAYPDNDRNLIVEVPAWRPDPSVMALQYCRADKEVLRTLEAIVTQLATVPDRRKAVVYFGGDMPWAAHPTANPCGTYWMWQDVFDAAQRGHVTINPIDTFGFKDRVGRIGSELNHASDVHLTVADNTGGHAVVNTNDFEPGLRQILLENSSYYLLAYQPTHDADDGTFRRIDVKVNRPDLEVRTRRSYWAPREPKPNQPPPEPASPQVEAMAGILPQSKLALRAAAAPFAIGLTGRAVVAVSIGVRQPPLVSRTTEGVDLLIKAFDADHEAASDTQVITVTVPAARADANESRYDLLARIEVPKPGRYEIRLSTHSAISNTLGSVYVDVDVPDYRKDRVSLSGAIVNVMPGSGPVAPARALNDLTPIYPMTDRSFAAANIVTVFTKIYQGGKDAIAPVIMKVQIKDARGTSAFDQSDTLAAARFNVDRAADYQIRLPLAKLTAGEYLLTIEAGIGRNISKRDVQFTVRP